MGKRSGEYKVACFSAAFNKQARQVAKNGSCTSSAPTQTFASMVSLSPPVVIQQISVQSHINTRLADLVGQYVSFTYPLLSPFASLSKTDIFKVIQRYASCQPQLIKLLRYQPNRAPVHRALRLDLSVERIRDFQRHFHFAYSFPHSRVSCQSSQTMQRYYNCYKLVVLFCPLLYHEYVTDEEGLCALVCFWQWELRPWP